MKYTKKQYLVDVQSNENKIKLVESLLLGFEIALSNGIPIEDISDAWNGAHDSKWELEQERMDIERRWSQRNWTWQDHSEHSLIMQNID